jgi:predicted metalloprotease with PDZ domain
MIIGTMATLSVLLLILAMRLQEPGLQPVQYTVSLKEPQTQMVDIHMLIPNVSGSTLDVALPVWRPGRYEILDLAGGIRDVRASSASGSSLPVVKTDKTTWRITTNGAPEVRVSYRVYANSLADRTRHVDDTHAFLSGAAIFFYSPERREDPVVVNLEAPANWKIATGLEATQGNPRRFTAANYDVLADSPLEIGTHDLIQFDVNGKPHEIAVWGGAKYEPEKLKTDFSKIIKSQADIFGELPYRRYVFLIHVGPEARGATEHLNSTIIQAPRRSLENEEAYKSLLGTVAHEYFHTWNVKQFRPAGIHPYDYSRENYTDLLWVAEGTTSYYDDLTLARTGLNKPDDYLKIIGDEIHSIRNRPGARVQNLAESSFDAWVKFNQPTPDDANATVSFYSAGALASLLMDMELRSRTQNRVSLDDVMRTMYRRFPLSGSGYTTADLIAVLEELSGVQWDAFFSSYINGTEEFPFETALNFVGLELALDPEKKEETGKQVPYAGLTLGDRNAGALVRSAVSDGPAYRAGVIAGDEIVAVNGRRVSASQFDELIGKLQPGDTVNLHVIRRDELRNISFKLAGKPNGRWKVSRVKQPTDAQKRAYQSWLQNDWPASSGNK